MLNEAPCVFNRATDIQMLLVKTGLSKADPTNHGNLKLGGTDIIKIL